MAVVRPAKMHAVHDAANTDARGDRGRVFLRVRARRGDVSRSRQRGTSWLERVPSAGRAAGGRRQTLYLREQRHVLPAPPLGTIST